MVTKYISGVAAGLVLIGGSFLIAAPSALAFGHQRLADTHHHHDKSGGGLPGPGKDYFILTHYAATPAGKSNTYDLTVTVEQYQFDGNDKTNNETHYFPGTVPVTWSGGKTTASLQGSAPGINYKQGQTGNVSATATYTIAFPTALISTTKLSIGPFYMVGPVQTNSQDDVVYDSPISIPYGELPEVPWAAALPLVGLAIGSAVWLRKRRAMV